MITIMGMESFFIMLTIILMVKEVMKVDNTIPRLKR